MKLRLHTYAILLDFKDFKSKKKLDDIILIFIFILLIT